jgi:hypothetical protein
LKSEEADETGEPRRFLTLIPGQPEEGRAPTAVTEPVSEPWRTHGLALMRFACKLLKWVAARATPPTALDLARARRRWCVVCPTTWP